MLVLPGALSARDRHGASIVVILKDGRDFEGELIAVKPDSLLLFSSAGRDESVDLAGIRSVRIDRRSKALLGAACGALAGLVGTIIYDLATKEPESIGGGIEHAFEVGGMFLLLVPTGLVAGTTAGALAGKDKTIKLEGKSESEVGKGLAYLRGKARVRDFR